MSERVLRGKAGTSLWYVLCGGRRGDTAARFGPYLFSHEAVRRLALLNGLGHDIRHYKVEAAKKIVDLELPICFNLDSQFVAVVELVEHERLVPHRTERLLLNRCFLLRTLAIASKEDNNVRI